MHSYLQELMEVWQKWPSSTKQKSKHSCRSVDVKWTLTVILHIIIVNTVWQQHHEHDTKHGLSLPHA